MKVLVLLFLASIAVAARDYKIYSIDLAEGYFEDFIKTYNKHYADEAEKTRRFEIFKQNLVHINSKNLRSSSAVFGITRFSDLTKEEFINTYTGYKEGKRRDGSQCTPGPSNASAPDAWDWKAKGAISKAKDQGRCGSCWAFSAIGNVEGFYAIKHNNELVDLSEQQVVDCDKRSDGCEGTSDIQYPFLYLMEHAGSMLEQDYPYKSRQDQCRYDSSKEKAMVIDCLAYRPNSEDELKNVVYNGPVSIGLDATSMMSYIQGVLKDCSYSELNHAVLIVGYGTENGTPYWLIKNSWGESFGEDGFIKIERGVNACGLMDSIMVQAVVN